MAEQTERAAVASAPMPRPLSFEASRAEVYTEVVSRTRDGYTLRWQAPGIRMEWDVDEELVTVGPEREGYWALEIGDVVLLEFGDTTPTTR